MLLLAMLYQHARQITAARTDIDHCSVALIEKRQFSRNVAEDRFLEALPIGVGKPDALVLAQIGTFGKLTERGIVQRAETSVDALAHKPLKHDLAHLAERAGRSQNLLCLREGIASESNPKELDDIAQVASHELEAAVAIVPPADANFARFEAQLLCQPQDLDVAHVAINSRERKDGQRGAPGEEFEAALGVAYIGQADNHVHPDGEDARADAAKPG